MQTGNVLDMWKIDGKRINIRTFNRLVDALVDKGEMKVAFLPTGDRLFDEDEAKRLKKYLPKRQPERYYGVVNYVLDEIAKDKKRK